MLLVREVVHYLFILHYFNGDKIDLGGVFLGSNLVEMKSSAVLIGKIDFLDKRVFTYYNSLEK